MARMEKSGLGPPAYVKGDVPTREGLCILSEQCQQAHDPSSQAMACADDMFRTARTVLYCCLKVPKTLFREAGKP